MTIRSAQVTIGALACLLTSSWTNAQTMKPFRSPGLPADGAALPGAPREVPRGTDPAAGQRLYSATSQQANANLPVQTLDVPGGGGPRHAVLGPGDDLLPGNYIYIGDDFANPQAPTEFILLLQVDGNLVLYQATLASGYKSSRFSWLEIASDCSWEPTRPRACKTGTFSNRLRLSTCRISCRLASTPSRFLKMATST